MITPLQSKRLDILAAKIADLPPERRDVLTDELNAFSPEDAAKACGVHSETVRRWIRDGELKAAKIGHKWFISRTELERFWRSRGGGKLFADSPDSEGGDE